MAYACNPRYVGGGLQFETNAGEIVQETLSWTYPTQKGLVEWLKSYSTCLASMRPGVQTLVKKRKSTESFYWYSLLTCQFKWEKLQLK
jgi:hypothetical protein